MAPGKGILAADESTGTIGKRFEGISEFARRLGRSPQKEGGDVAAKSRRLACVHAPRRARAPRAR